MPFDAQLKKSNISEGIGLSLSMQDKLKRRKLDALKRGIHRASGGDVLPVSTHMVGIGRAGAGVIAQTLNTLAPDAPKFHALAVDIGDHDLGELRDLAATFPSDRASVTIFSLSCPSSREQLLNDLGAYPEYLALEYPRRVGHDLPCWLSSLVDLPKPGAPVPRAVAKAIYGLAYYAGARPMERVLRQFAATVEASEIQAVIAIVFGLGGGTGSGIAVDLARHLSTRMLGRRALVTGVAIAPCAGDTAERNGSHSFAATNELDCFGDEGKVEGVVAACGELFRNPFTAGFLLVPQQHLWAQTNDLAATHIRVGEEIASLLTGRAGINLWEILRLLNWVAAPSTQHSAARTPWGAKWIHILGFADIAGPLAIDGALPAKLGLLPSYMPEYVEARTASYTDADALSGQLQEAFNPDVPPQIEGGGTAGSVQFILPCVAKTDLALFYDARAAYDAQTLTVKTLDHALLLEQGVVLSEPSTRLVDMAGAGLDGCDAWIAVPFAALRGDGHPHDTRSVRDAA